MAEPGKEKATHSLSLGNRPIAMDENDDTTILGRRPHDIDDTKSSTMPRIAKRRKQEFQPGSMENTLEDVEEFLSDSGGIPVPQFEDANYSMLSTPGPSSVNESVQTPKPNFPKMWGDVAEEREPNKHKADPFYRTFYQDRKDEEIFLREYNERRKRHSSCFSDSGVETDRYLADVSEEIGDSQLEDAAENIPEDVDEFTNADTSFPISQNNATFNANSQVEESIEEEDLIAIEPAIDPNAMHQNEMGEATDSETATFNIGDLVHSEIIKEGNKSFFVMKYELASQFEASVAEQPLPNTINGDHNLSQVLESEASSSKISTEEDLNAEMHCIPSTSTVDKNEESLESLKNSIRLQGQGEETKNYKMEEGTAKMKYRSTQTFEFSNKQPKYVVAFMVHKIAKYAKVPINAEDAIPVSGVKNAPMIPASRKCPFIVENTEVYYRTFHDKTYGAVHGAVVRVEDALRIVPDMVSKNENYLNINIGNKEACRLHLKFVIAPITDEVFDQVVIEDQDNIFLSCNSVLKSFEQNVEFMKELKGPKKKIVDRSQEINFPTQSYMWPLEETQLPEHQAAIKAFKKEIHMTLKLKSVEEGKTFMANVRSLMQ